MCYTFSNKVQIYIIKLNLVAPSHDKIVFLHKNKASDYCMQPFEHILQQAATVLATGGIILYPTDTIWGIGCDAANPSAVEKIYAVKQRDHAKSMLVLALDEWVKADNPVLADLFASQRPTTVIVNPCLLPYMPTVASNLPAADGTVGIRVPRHDLCQQLLQRLGHPIVSTSANFSGQQSPSTFGDIASALTERIDYCVPNLSDFESHNSHGSRIVKMNSDNTITIIRD